MAFASRWEFNSYAPILVLPLDKINPRTQQCSNEGMNWRFRIPRLDRFAKTMLG